MLNRRVRPQRQRRLWTHSLMACEPKISSSSSSSSIKKTRRTLILLFLLVVFNTYSLSCGAMKLLRASSSNALFRRLQQHRLQGSSNNGADNMNRRYMSLFASSTSRRNSPPPVGHYDEYDADSGDNIDNIFSSDFRRKFSSSFSTNYKEQGTNNRTRLIENLDQNVYKKDRGLSKKITSQTDNIHMSIGNNNKNNNNNDMNPNTNQPPIVVASSSGVAAEGVKRKSYTKDKVKPTFSDLITKVETVEDARRVIRIIEQTSARNKNQVWACDTEVADIDLKLVGPVGNGKVICASIFGGPDVDFGDGPGTAVWIDNLDAAEGVLQEFKNFFENEQYFKVWHNYGFDRHVMHNEGIDCRGFMGDTFHMARLWDSSREKAYGSGEGYSLESLSNSVIEDDRFKKKSMKDLFGVGKPRKDGTESLVKQLPPLRDVQRSPDLRQMWIEYSAKDAIATWWLRFNLEEELKKKEWCVGGAKRGTMFDFYMEYMVDFGELLTDMERNGIKLDTEVHLKEAERRAREERKKMEEIFLAWAEGYCKDARYINTASSTQIQQLLFGKYEKEKLVQPERVFGIDKEEGEYAEEVKSLAAANPYAALTSPDLKKLLKERGMKLAGKKADLIQRLLDHDSGVSQYTMMDETSLQDICATRGLSFFEGAKEQLVQQLVDDDSYRKSMTKSQEEAISPPEKVKRYREITIKTIGMKPLEFTPAGSAQVSAAILKKLAGQNLFGEEKDMVFGEAFNFFGKGEGGLKACQAIGALANIGQIDATITNFLVPLQALVDKNNRIHCSLNLNTETGRLSSRRPNLQNQPALEKDQYKIRDAFVAEPGNTLIVADYGQLELRILAHITNCKSMQDAFTQGGCFHSRTAVGMYPYIKEAVDGGKVLLEWDYSKGQPTVPLVKDTYASERRKAKTLNFSIAYGKTVHGLAQDWGISTASAEETLEAWYRDRPEVKQWQDETRKFCMKNGYVRTIMGRTRELPDATRRGPGQGHALRAAINTPIQGSAADIVMMAMRELWKDKELKTLGWRLLLQIHDEVILEGPKETKDAALARVRSVMENPYDEFGLSRLSVHLDVDAKSADTWYKAK